MTPIRPVDVTNIFSARSPSSEDPVKVPFKYVNYRQLNFCLLTVQEYIHRITQIEVSCLFEFLF